MLYQEFESVCGVLVTQAPLFCSHQAGPSAKSSQTGDSSLLSLEQLLKTENLAEAKASEEDKLKAVMYQSSLCYYSSR
nr:E3 ubiquitin-protein ligase RBBP6-like [Danio rerio]|eukprot:XP_021328099.1 E3 ubiquitin-protein ligase RBBP6-like [Danio rerio]